MAVNLAGVGPDNKNRAEHDFYMTNPTAVNVISQFENINHNVWENCAGLGHISNRFKSLGHSVRETDLIKRYEGVEVFDFLTYDSVVDGVFHGDIVTNPPFCHMNEWIRLSHSACTGKVIIFAALNMTSTQTKYYNVFKKFSLKKIVAFSHRLGCCRDGKFKTGNAVQYAWFVFDREFIGATEFVLVGKTDNIEKDFDSV